LVRRVIDGIVRDVPDRLTSAPNTVSPRVLSDIKWQHFHVYRQPVVGLTVVRLPATVANIELKAAWAAERQLLRRIELPNEFHLVLTELASRPLLRKVTGQTSDAIQPTLRLAVVAHHPGDAMDHPLYLAPSTNMKGNLPAMNDGLAINAQ
ncbi:MAG: hypothetical protein WCH39_27775, partial [Schlesneria sp.]